MIETLPLMPVHMSFALSHNTQLAIVVHIEEQPKQSILKNLPAQIAVSYSAGVSQSPSGFLGGRPSLPCL